jgi:hypothetical protein
MANIERPPSLVISFTDCLQTVVCAWLDLGDVGALKVCEGTLAVLPEPTSQLTMRRLNGLTKHHVCFHNMRAVNYVICITWRHSYINVNSS